MLGSLTGLLLAVYVSISALLGRLLLLVVLVSGIWTVLLLVYKDEHQSLLAAV